jgi:2-dehydropantoate 2-reductase
MKILILGAGAVGGYFGALLQNAGIDVTFLVREKRAEYLTKNGLNIDSPLGNLIIFPKVVTGIHPSDGYQLTIISCKAYALDDAIKTLALLNESCYILPLLNGFSHYARLCDFFEKDRVMGGFAHLSVMLNKDGSILHLNSLQVLTAGALQPSQKEFLDYMKGELSEKAPFIVFSETIETDIWKKMVFISTVASATCIMNQSMGAISSIPEKAESVSQSFELNCRAADFAGYPLDDEWKKETLAGLLNPKSIMTSSLLRDMRNGNPVEVSILEDMLQKNKQARLSNELLESAIHALKVYKDHLN